MAYVNIVQILVFINRILCTLNGEAGQSQLLVFIEIIPMDGQ